MLTERKRERERKGGLHSHIRRIVFALVGRHRLLILNFRFAIELEAVSCTLAPSTSSSSERRRERRCWRTFCSSSYFTTDKMNKRPRAVFLLFYFSFSVETLTSISLPSTTIRGFEIPVEMIVFLCRACGAGRIRFSWNQSCYAVESEVFG